MKARLLVLIILGVLALFQNCSPVNFDSVEEMQKRTSIANGCEYNGQHMTDGQSFTAFASPTVAYGGTCLSETRVCHLGVVSGSFTAPSCVVGPPANCTLNGQTIPHGGSVTEYQAASVPHGSTCNSEGRICTNGVLSGSYTNPACTVLAPPRNFPLPPAGVNVHIQCYVDAGWYQSLRVTTADGVVHDYPMGSGSFAAAPIDVVYATPPISMQAFHNGAENSYRYPDPYTGVSDHSVGFETEDGFDYDYNDLDCYFSW